MKSSSPSSQISVPASRSQAPNQSSASPSAPLPVMRALAPPALRAPNPPPADQRVYRNIRRTTQLRNSTSPYGGRQGRHPRMQQPAAGVRSSHPNMVPVPMINNAVLSYDHMGWNYRWNVTEWTLTVSPSNYPSPLRMPSHLPPHDQHLNPAPAPAPVNNQAAAPIPAPAVPAAAPDNRHAAPPTQPDQPADDPELDLSLHL